MILWIPLLPVNSSCPPTGFALLAPPLPLMGPIVVSLLHPAVGPWAEQGGALSEVGETLHQVAVARDELDASVQHAFIDPLQELHSTELKDIRVG